MSIQRSRTVPRASGLEHAVQRPGLSFRAIGVLAFMLSQPVGVSFSVSDLVEFSSASRRRDGRDSIYSTITELVDAGYIVRRQLRDDDGQLAGVEHEVFAVPQAGGEA